MGKVLRPITQSYAEPKTLRTPILSGLEGIITQVTQSSMSPHMCVGVPTAHMNSALRFVRNLRNTHFVRTLSALIPSAYSLLTILSFSCVINKKRFITDSNAEKEEALLEGVMR